MGQHIEIITRSKSLEEALFYIQQVIDKGLSRPALINCIKSNLYKHQGKIINNFTDHLPTLQSKLVQEVLKENYDFGFATVNHEIYDEAELEESLTDKYRIIVPNLIKKHRFGTIIPHIQTFE